MYKISRIIALSVLGFLAIQTHAIKLTNSTNDNLLYCCGNPADKNTILPKQDLNALSTVEITETENYVQIYSKKPQALRGKYPLSDQTEDLTIVTDPMFGYKFKLSAEVSQAEPKKLAHNIGQPMFGPKKPMVGNRPQNIPTTTPSVSPTKKTKLTHPTQNRPQYTGRRKPNRTARNNNESNEPQVTNEIISDVQQIDHIVNAEDTNTLPTSFNSDEEPSQAMAKATNDIKKVAPSLQTIATLIETKFLPGSQKIDSREDKKKQTNYFTKKKLAVALGAVGVASLMVWWLRTIKLPIV